MIALIEEGEGQPTARAVAERAGVSLRLVFHHFEDMEQVLRAAVAVQAQRHWNKLVAVDPSLPLGRRVEDAVRQLGALYDHIAPVRRVAAHYALQSPTVQAQLAHGRRLVRTLLADTFSPELGAAGRRSADVLDGLEVTTSFESWDLLRDRLGRSPAAARRITGRTMTAVLGGTGPDLHRDRTRRDRIKETA